MKGSILAGGSGIRFYPIAQEVIKQLLPVYDKPMIYNPLSRLILSSITEILIISTPEVLPAFDCLLGDGSHLGLNLSYIVQPKPEGLVQVFILGEDEVCLILGDNIYHGHGLPEMLYRSKEIVKIERKLVIFGYYVTDLQRYGVAEFDEKGKGISIEEKPQNPKRNYAVTGLYFYTNDVTEATKQIKSSARGKLEIINVNQNFLEKDALYVELVGSGSWLDICTRESLLDESNFIQTIENRQGLKVSCIEEIAFEMGYIDAEVTVRLNRLLKKNNYSQYLPRRVKVGKVAR